MIESRGGKYTLVGVLLLLSGVLATSRPKTPHIVYPLAAVVAVMAAGLAWRIKPAPPIERSYPLGDPLAFIAAVPRHVEHLAAWVSRRGLSPPPTSVPEMDEWIWSNRETLGEEWGGLMHGLVAAYGQALRARNASLAWSVRGGEPVLASPRSLRPGEAGLQRRPRRGLLGRLSGSPLPERVRAKARKKAAKPRAKARARARPQAKRAPRRKRGQ